MNQGLRNGQNTFQNAKEGDKIEVILDKSHPIAKIRFGPEFVRTGGFVSFKHGVLKLVNTQNKFVMIPAMVISEVRIVPLATVQ